ncbi:hypothetical protein DSM104635_01659 [Terricaulis silvestris]|uniref:Uncharacterized protein n=1 Tax=Terricaulis silvestris TaxID=2686094 RepID=A0A6I6MPW4_9CAUL|nr:hypothetical protein DSM104635_01659 [Terricaulis silvestris]
MLAKSLRLQHVAGGVLCLTGLAIYVAGLPEHYVFLPALFFVPGSLILASATPGALQLATAYMLLSIPWAICGLLVTSGVLLGRFVVPQRAEVNLVIFGLAVLLTISALLYAIAFFTRWRRRT